ncbi:hypothetical protein BGZ94_003844 [Podila epigama]|nr:hypothetical protein BGZ94_003844 [Podila epigama]
MNPSPSAQQVHPASGNNATEVTSSQSSSSLLTLHADATAQMDSSLQPQQLLRHRIPGEEGDEDEDEDEDTVPLIIVRALYPFESKDAASLPFEKDALIQVLTRLESGWWYGFCNNERGWFPSNYVQEISEEELEMELELAMLQQDDTDNHRSNDPQSELEDHDDMASNKRIVIEGEDLWLPQTTSEGQVFYYNTRTGESTWTIPTPIDGRGDYSDDGAERHQETQRGRTLTRSISPSRRHGKPSL